MNAVILDIMNKAGSMIATDRLVHNGKLSGSAKVMEGLVAAVTDLEAQKNNAYDERNKVVAALTKLLPAWLSPHGEGAEKGWSHIVYVLVPTHEGHMQASWHVPDEDLIMFTHLLVKDSKWDGHTTEEKYKRLSNMKIWPFKDHV